MIVFPFIIQEQLISSSFCKILGWSILIQSFAKFIMGDILADTAILGIAIKKEPLCSCYEHTRRAHIQLDGVAAEKEGFVCQENLSTCNYSWIIVFSFRLDSYFTLLNLSFVENNHICIFNTFAKQSMINRLSNPINRNRSAAKISKVMSSTR